nr:MAG TPA: hypothetical protein [Caudoviricetes sp.]
MLCGSYSPLVLKRPRFCNRHLSVRKEFDK